jgi:ribosomal protein S6
MEEKDTKNYEFGFLINGMLTDVELVAFLDSVEKFFTDLGAKISKRSTPERKVLTYLIKKQKEAYFVFFQLDIEPEKIDEIKNKFRYEANILRYLCLTPAPNFGKVMSSDPRAYYKEDHRGPRKEEKSEIKEAKTEVKEEPEEVDLEGLDKKLGEIEGLA